MELFPCRISYIAVMRKTLYWKQEDILTKLESSEMRYIREFDARNNCGWFNDHEFLYCALCKKSTNFTVSLGSSVNL